MILGDDGKRMSKRHGAVSVMQYEKDGILPHAMLNYLARLGWSHGDQEIFSIQELRDLFALEDCQKSGSVFDTTKLLWVNQQHMANQSDEELGEALTGALQLTSVSIDDGPPVSRVAAVLKERAQSFAEMAEQADIFYKDAVELDEKAAKKQLRPVALPVLEAVHEKLSTQDQWIAVSLKTELESIAEELAIGFGKIGQPLRVAITGAGASPDIGDTLELIGKERSLARIASAIDYVKARAEGGS